MAKSFGHKYLLIITILMYVAFGLVTAVIGVIIDKFQSEYNLPLQIAALLPFAFYLAYGFFSIPFGIAMDRVGARFVLMLGMLLMTTGSFLFYLSSNYMIVILMIFLIGIGVTAIQTAGNPFIRELDTPSKYTANLTAVVGIGALGYAISPLLVPMVERIGFSWNSVYLIFGIINALLMILLFLAKFPEVHILEEEKINLAQVTLLLKNPVIQLYSIGIFLYVGAEVGTSSYILIFMNNIHGVGYQNSFWEQGSIWNAAFPSKSALAVAFFWLLQAIGRLIISPLMKRIGEKKIFIFHSLGTIIFLIIAIVGNTNISLISFALVGYFTCASFTSIFSAAVNSFDSNHGTISGILGTAIAGGAFIGWLIGAVGGFMGMQWGMAINLIAFGYVFYLSIWGKGKLDVE
jgi:MFS transporter, FHS family, L-fucose permease